MEKQLGFKLPRQAKQQAFASLRHQLKCMARIKPVTASIASVRIPKSFQKYFEGQTVCFHSTLMPRLPKALNPPAKVPQNPLSVQSSTLRFEWFSRSSPVVSRPKPVTISTQLAKPSYDNFSQCGESFSGL